MATEFAKISAEGIGSSFTTTKVAAAPAPLPPIVVDKRTLRILIEAGIDRCDDGNRLTVEQLDRLLVDCRSTQSRIEMKKMMLRLGVYPRELIP